MISQFSKLGHPKIHSHYQFNKKNIYYLLYISYNMDLRF